MFKNHVSKFPNFLWTWFLNGSSSKHGYAPAKVAGPQFDAQVRDAMIEKKKYVPEKLSDVLKRQDKYMKRKNKLSSGDLVQLNKNLGHKIDKAMLSAVSNFTPAFWAPE